MQQESKDLLYLLRILEATEKIILYSKEYKTPEGFLFKNDQKDYNASLLLLIHIGEQSAKVSIDTKKKFPDIRWQRIKAFRNRVAHDYVNIDSLIVFSIIKKDLPLLVLQLSNCIKEQIQNNIFNVNELEISKGSLFYQHINFLLLQ